MDGLCDFYIRKHNVETSCTQRGLLGNISQQERGRTKMFSLIVREAMVEIQKKQKQKRNEFIKPTITPSGEDYLETILVLQKNLGMVRSVDVARHMDVSKPSVCHAMATLRDGGFLTMDEDHFLHLTDLGWEVAEAIYEKHRFFTKQLIAAGVDPMIAEKDACRIEHVISEESFQRLKESASKGKEHIWQVERNDRMGKT